MWWLQLLSTARMSDRFAGRLLTARTQKLIATQKLLVLLSSPDICGVASIRLFDDGNKALSFLPPSSRPPVTLISTHYSTQPFTFAQFAGCCLLLALCWLGFLFGVFSVLHRRYLDTANAGKNKEKDPFAATRDQHQSSVKESVPADLFTTALHHQRGVRWLHEIFERSAAQFPHASCFRVADSPQTFSFAEFSVRAEAVKNFLVNERYVTKGDTIVGLFLPTRGCWEAFAAQLGCWKSGAAVVVLDPELPDEVLRGMVEDC